jgi:hypothetical protein
MEVGMQGLFGKRALRRAVWAEVQRVWNETLRNRSRRVYPVKTLCEPLERRQLLTVTSAQGNRMFWEEE